MVIGFAVFKDAHNIQIIGAFVLTLTALDAVVQTLDCGGPSTFDDAFCGETPAKRSENCQRENLHALFAGHTVFTTSTKMTS